MVHSILIGAKSFNGYLCFCVMTAEEKSFILKCYCNKTNEYEFSIPSYMCRKGFYISIIWAYLYMY